MAEPNVNVIIIGGGSFDYTITLNSNTWILTSYIAEPQNRFVSVEGTSTAGWHWTSYTPTFMGNEGISYDDPSLIITLTVTFRDDEGGGIPDGKYCVTTIPSPMNGGTAVVAKAGTSSFSTSITLNLGESYTIKATPSEGYKFVKWMSSDGEEDTSPISTHSGNSNITWTAEFARVPSYKLIWNG